MQEQEEATLPEPEFPVFEYPHPALKMRCKEVENFLGVDTAVAIMKTSMEKEGGLGLAANQLGFEYRVFVMADSVAVGGKSIFVNPKMTNHSEETVEGPEGCLSFPNIVLKVQRWKEIDIEAQDEHGNLFIMHLFGLPAVVFQHELDHLDGKTFLDYLPRLRRDIAERKIRKSQKAKKINEKKMTELQQKLQNRLYSRK